MSKIILYQIFTRLFGNDTAECTPGGDITVNGCGKFNKITTKALEAIRNLGVTHVWYTGIIEHTTCTDYSAYGITPDHPAMIKGVAGSPYAIKDYYAKSGRQVGFKAAGGIRTAEEAALYYTIVKEILGEEWLTPELFRIGASSLANNLLSAIEGEDVKYF